MLEEALRAGVERVVHTSSVAAIGPAPRGATADETQVFRAGRFGLPYVNSKHEAENEALRIAAHGLPLVIVNPAHVLGKRRRRTARRPSSCAGSCGARSPPTSTGRSTSSTPRTSRAGHLLADERGVVGERYILGNRNFTLDRLFADLGRLSGVEPPAVKLPVAAALQLAHAAEALPGTPDRHRRRGARRVAVVGLPLDEGQARARLEALPPRGHARRHDRVVPQPRRRPDARRPARASRPLLRLTGFGLRQATGVAGALRGG